MLPKDRKRILKFGKRSSSISTIASQYIRTKLCLEVVSRINQVGIMFSRATPLKPRVLWLTRRYSSSTLEPKSGRERIVLVNIQVICLYFGFGFEVLFRSTDA